ncbi:hypothetical protein GQX74_010464 [Glossina fuscipes]|nr:hypothetical protein GQX74_010464 [Glossina fuscipes]
MAVDIIKVNIVSLQPKAVLSVLLSKASISCRVQFSSPGALRRQPESLCRHVLVLHCNEIRHNQIFGSYGMLFLLLTPVHYSMIPFARFFTLIADNPFNIRRKSKEKELIGWLKVHYKGQPDYVFRSDLLFRNFSLLPIEMRTKLLPLTAFDQTDEQCHTSVYTPECIGPLVCLDVCERCHTNILNWLTLIAAFMSSQRHLWTINPPAARELKKPCNPWIITLPILLGNKSLDIS